VLSLLRACPAPAASAALSLYGACLLLPWAGDADLASAVLQLLGTLDGTEPDSHSPMCLPNPRHMSLTAVKTVMGVLIALMVPASRCRGPATLMWPLRCSSSWGRSTVRAQATIRSYSTLDI
jgi:hypothetical protein